VASNDDWDEGDLVIDASGNVAQKGFTGTGWWMVLGWMPEEYPYESLTQPLRKLVPAVYPERAGGGDPFLYKLTYENGSVKHGTRRVMANAVSRTNTGGPNYRRGLVVKVEREAVPAVWEDVTSLFIKS
jgi:hypothetical protein